MAFVWNGKTGSQRAHEKARSQTKAKTDGSFGSNLKMGFPSTNIQGEFSHQLRQLICRP
jgi:hypothetical protein